MEGFVLFFRFIFICVALAVFIYIVLPDIYGNKKPKSSSTLDEIEKESIEILNKKQEIRGVTEQTQTQINNINQNLEK